MKITRLTLAAMLMLTLAAPLRARGEASISDLEVKGRIEGENIVFDLLFKADCDERNTLIPLVQGDVAHLDSDLPRKSELTRQDNTFFLQIPSRGKHNIRFRFASLAAKEDAWRQTKFVIPGASIRKLSVICDRDDLEIVFPGALNVERKKTRFAEDGQHPLKSAADGEEIERTEVTAYLGLTREFVVRWKPTVKKLSGELAVTCDVNTIALASVGALKVDNLFSYSVVQGTLKKLSFALPKDINVTQVRGADIQDWLIDESADGLRTMTVTLARPKEDSYSLQVESEAVLAKFPCKLELPVIAPKDVIRSSGFLMLGTDSAIKLLVDKAVGLTQVDQAAFPVCALEDAAPRSIPARSQFAYQYANLPYTMAFAADDIVPAYNSDEQIVLSVKDSDLVFSASVEVDVRDAPARELVIETDPAWTVANVSGAALSDYDVRDKDGKRNIHAYFRDAVLGRVLLEVRLEQTLKADETAFKAPVFSVLGSKAERGYVALAAEKGLRIIEQKAGGLREVNTGSISTRVEGIQRAYRFKESRWELALQLERTQPTIHTEMFQLVSVGEGVLYCSCAVTYHIDGAPVRTFKIRIPAEYQNVEFTGRDVRGWEHEGETWSVSLQEKVIGDYTLGITFDRPYEYKGGDINVGGVQTQGTTTESGYIVLASSASLNLKPIEQSESMIRIEPAELPEAYTLLVEDQILAAFKYVREPHMARIKLERYETEALLDHVADHTSLSTELSKDGEAVTTIVYSIKNLSKQYLSLTLPKGGRLWTARIVDSSGTRTPVTAMQEGDRTMIPIRRLTDPNTPIQVEVVYAQSLRKLGKLGRRLEFESPVATEMPGTFAEWKFKAPERYAASGVGGNMSTGALPQARGIVKAFADILRCYGAIVTRGTGGFIFAVCVVAVLSLLAYYRGQRVTFWWRVLLAILALVILVPLCAIIHEALVPQIRDMVSCRIPSVGPARGTVTLTKTVSLAATEPLRAEITVVPSWLGVRSSLSMAVIAGLAGFVVLMRGGRRGSGAAMRALGATLFTFGLAEIFFLRVAISVLIGAGFPIWAVYRCVRDSFRKGRAQCPDAEDSGGPPPFEADAPQASTAGSAGIGAVLGCLTAGVLAVAGSLALAQDSGYSELSADSVEISVQAPASTEETAKSAAVNAVFEFEADEGEYLLLRPPAVLTSYDLKSRHLSMQVSTNGYVLVIDRKGEYRIALDYSVPVVEQEGAWFLGVEIPENLRNRLSLKVPGQEMEIESPDAVLLQTSEKDGVSEAIATYGAAGKAHISWRARARKAKLEKVAFFCEVNTLATMEPGVADLANLVRYQIAQGELKTLRVSVPEGMNVTSVQAPGLSTWRYDPATRVLEAILENPASADFTLEVMTQIPCEGLPYEISIGAPVVQDASRQRGSLSLAAPDSVQVQAEAIEGLNPMNIEDVSPDAVAAARRGLGALEGVTIKRAFRYDRLPVALKVRAERVLPELRVVENASLSIADERVVLSSQLQIDVSRAGVFYVYLGIPEGFDIETLTGQDVSHWDEVGGEVSVQGGGTAAEGQRWKSRGVVVHFRKQVLGARNLNVVISRTEKGVEQAVTVPRIDVAEALKHSGSLVVSGERGVRLMTTERDGVSEVNPRELGIRETGVLAFRLLRPGWRVQLKADVVAPTLRSEVLHRVDLSEGLMQCAAYIQYRIDNAGCKTFRLQAPAPGIPLSVTGADISRVAETDKAKGIWEVELHHKREDKAALEVHYQVPFAAEEAAILPLRTPDVETQKGYLVVMSGGRVEVKPTGDRPGLKAEEARAIPASFGAGDLSDAIQCYRTIGADYALTLTVKRHGSAEILSAGVNNVTMTSAVSDGGQMLTQVVLNMTMGSLPALEFKLPGGEATLWSAFVKGKAASVSRDGEIYRIPMQDVAPGETAVVEFVYAGKAPKRWFSRRQRYEGPVFIGLPSKEIDWTLFMSPERRYYGFGGTMEYKSTPRNVAWFTAENYVRNNLRMIEGNKEKARSIIAQTDELVKNGDQWKARKALESAINYSQNDMTFNEDARIQYKNLVGQQAVVSLVNRRDQMRMDRNIQDNEQVARMRDFKNGQYSAEYAAKVQQSLSDRESDSLMQVAGKILDQQAAAERVASTIMVTMPTHGRQLQFHRSLQINPQSELSVSFKSSRGTGLRILALVLVTACLLAGYWRMFARREA